MALKRNAALEAVIDEAIVDAYGDDEQLAGLFTMIEDHLVLPFTTTVLGVEVTVQKVDLTADSIVAVCTRGPAPAEDRPARPAAAHTGAGWRRVDRRLPALGRRVRLR